MKVVLLILALSAIAYSGQIFSWSDPFIQNYQIDGAAASPSYTLYFTLENPLTTFSYLRIVFPYAYTQVADPAVIANVYTGSTRCGADPSAAASLGTLYTSGSVSVSAISGDANAAFVKFTQVLEKGKQYAINIKANALSGPVAGLSGQVGLFTTTDNQANYMIIDSNPHFADWEWTAASGALTISDYAVDANLTNNLAASYNLNFSFTPAAAYLGGAVVKIIGSAPFAFTTCTILSVAGNASNVPVLWTCALAPGSTSTVLLNAPDWLPASTVLVKLGVTNPNAINRQDVTIQIYRRNNAQLVEKGTGSGWLSSVWSTSWNTTASIVNLAYGPVGTQQYHPLRFYRQAVGTNAIIYYQTYKFMIKPILPLPSGFKTTVELNLGAPAAIQLMIDSSINHNLDAIANAKVVCQTVFLTPNNIIRCTNVNLNNSATAYFISIKLAYKTATTAYPSAFGQVAVLVAANPDSTILVLPSGAAFIPATVITLPAVPTVIDPQHDPTTTTTPTTNTIKTSFVTGQATAAYADQTQVYDPNNTTSFLKYFMVNAASDETKVAAQLFGASPTNFGFDFYLNKYVTAPATIVGGIGVFVTGEVDAVLNATPNLNLFTQGVAVQGTDAIPYTRIKAGWTSTVPTLAQANATAFFIKVNGVTFKSAPSIRADEGSFEVYIGLITSYTNSTQPDSNLTWISKNGFYSALILSGPTTGLPATDTSITPFKLLGSGIVASSGADSYAGKYPSLLRLHGSLTSGESTNVNRLVIFFNQVIPYGLSVLDNTVNCVGSSGTVTTTPVCTYYDGVAIAGTSLFSNAAEILASRTAAIQAPRLEITWTGVFNASATFQILVPVAFPATSAATDIYAATLDAVTNNPLNFGYYKLGPATTLVLAAANPTYASGDIFTARYVPASTDKVGNVSTQSWKVQFNTSNYVVAGDINDNATRKVNSGFLYCAVWNFLANGTIGTQYLNTSAQEEKCLSFALPIATTAPVADTGPIAAATTGNTRWCMFCPISALSTIGSQATAVSGVTNFQLWNGGSQWIKQAGIMSPTIGCVVKNTGVIAYCDESYDAVTPGTITPTLSTSSITSTSIGNRITLTFALVNPFPLVSPLTVYQRVIAWRFNASQIVQESGSACVVTFGGVAGTCSFASAVAPPATGAIDAANLDNVTVSPSIITLPTPSGTGALSSPLVVVTIYGIKAASPAIIAAVAATTSFATRVYYGTSGGFYSTVLDFSAITGSTFNVTVGGATVAAPSINSIEFPLATARGARTSLRIGFKPTSREIYRSEKVIIQWNNTNLTTGTNAPANLLCEVYDQATWDFLPHFKSCVISTDMITLVANDNTDIPTGTVSPIVVIRGYTVVDWGVNGSLGGQLQSPAATIIQQTTTTSTVYNQPITTVNSAVSFGTSDVSLMRVQNQIGATSTLQFIIKNVANQTIMAGWRVIVDFPWYYSPRLSNSMNIRCFINNMSTLCDLADHRNLQVVFPTTTVANGSNFTLRIVGITNNKYTTAGMFYVALDNDMMSNSYIVHGWVADTATAAVDPTSTNILWLYNATVSSTAGGVASLRTNSNWNFMFQAKAAFSAGQVLVIDFPDLWTDVLATSIQGGMLTCSITTSPLNGTLGTNVTAAGVWWMAQANQIKLNFTAAIAVNSQLNVTCNNIRLPDMAWACVGQLPTFGVFDANETAPLGRSSVVASLVNRAFPITEVAMTIFMWNNNMASIPQGTSTVMGMENMLMAGSAFARGITLAISPAVAGIVLAPNSGMAMVGDASLKIALQVSDKANLGWNYVQFSKTESVATAMYAPVPILRVQVTNKKVMLMPPAAFSVPQGGKSIPVMYTFSAPPQADVTFTVMANDSAATVMPSTITLMPGMNKASVVVQLSGSAIIGNNVMLSLSQPSGTNAFAYNSLTPNSTLVMIGAAQTDSPLINIVPDMSSAMNSPLQQAVMITIGTTNMTATVIPPVTLFWTCALKSLMVNRDLVYTQAWAMLPPSTNGTGAEVFGTMAINQPVAAGTSYVIAGLIPNSAYNCRAWAINQVGNNGSNTTMFTTANNGGKLVRVNINFNQGLVTATSYQTLLCWLSQSYAVPASQIRTIWNEQCGKPANRMFAYNWTMIDAANVTNWVVPFYFLPNLRVAADTFAATVQTSWNTASWVTSLKTANNAFILANNYTVMNATVPSVAVPSVMNTSIGANVTFGMTVNMTSAFAYVGIWGNTSMPMVGDFLDPMSPSAPMSSGVAYFNGMTWSPPIVQIANLTSGMTYNLFYILTCEDPSMNAMNCASAVSAPIMISAGGAASTTSNPTTTNTNSGTTDARIISFSLGLIVMLFALFN